MNEACERTGGSVHVPYPFGIGKGCAMDDDGGGGFRVHCTYVEGSLRPFIGNQEILKIDADAGSVLLKNNVSRLCYDYPAGRRIRSASVDFSTAGFFHFSDSSNKVVFLGCGSAYVETDSALN
nr:unnamed protein product [Digitaria exilis]